MGLRGPRGSGRRAGRCCGAASIPRPRAEGRPVQERCSERQKQLGMGNAVWLLAVGVLGLGVGWTRQDPIDVGRHGGEVAVRCSRERTLNSVTCS